MSDTRMCRSIKPLFNLDSPATADEIRDAALQFVRKLSGYRSPSRVNEVAFNQGVDEVAAAADRLIHSLIARPAGRTHTHVKATHQHNHAA